MVPTVASTPDGIMSSIKLRSKRQGDWTLIRLLIEHPMETGRRRDEATGALVPAHFITEVRVEHNGQPRIQGLLTTGVSRNPYLSFRLKDVRPGDRVRVVWTDNQGRQDSAEIRIGD